MFSLAISAYFFLKKEFLHIETGELLDSSKLRSVIDTNKVEAFKNELGYYQIISSETKFSEKEIIDIYHGLSRIEDQFRVLKGEFSSRPIFVNTKEHIDAHLAVCTIALVVMRIIQLKVAAASDASPDKHWSYGISAKRVRAALNAWTVEALPDGLFRFNNLDDPDLKRILDAFGIDLPIKLYNKKELNAPKSSFSISN